MNLKLIGMIGAIILIVAIAGGVGIKLLQKAEGYKATGDQFNMRAEPRFGCATLKVYFNGGECDKPVGNPVSDDSK